MLAIDIATSVKNTLLYFKHMIEYWHQPGTNKGAEKQNEAEKNKNTCCEYHPKKRRERESTYQMWKMLREQKVVIDKRMHRFQ